MTTPAQLAILTRIGAQAVHLRDTDSPDEVAMSIPFTAAEIRACAEAQEAADEPVVWEVHYRAQSEWIITGTTSNPVEYLSAAVVSPQRDWRFRTASSPHLWQVADGKLVRPLGSKETIELGDEWAHLNQPDWTTVPPTFAGFLVSPEYGMRYRRTFHPFSPQETQPTICSPATSTGGSNMQTSEGKPHSADGPNPLTTPPQGAEVTDGEMLDALDKWVGPGYVGALVEIANAAHDAGSLRKALSNKVKAMQQPRQSHE